MKTVLNWSSGKDAALAYHLLRQGGVYDVRALLTTINAENERIVMHGVREELLDMQAKRMNLPLKKIHLPPSPRHDLYNHAMQQALDELKQEGITYSAFGDIHLEDLKQYREDQLKQAGFEAVFPLWKLDTRELVQAVEEGGIEAVIVCVNEKFLGKEYLGRKISMELLADLPDGVDPCGEYGEFHTFVYNAPYFSSPVAWKSGDVVHKVYPSANAEWDTGFWFMDVLPAD
ncbi:MAG: adenine nucleotide alpha hydrolase [Taibaiella sp.]|nr:adenine nucleotide alpha hydrolase [Taibaiella sp.]